MSSESHYPAFIANDAHYKAAKEFMENAPADADALESHEWLWDYASDLWELRRSIFATLDEKAENIIKYIGGGLGLVTLGTLAGIKSENAFLLPWVLPAAVMAVISILFAALVRSPRLAPSLPSIMQATEIARDKKEPNKSKAAFLGQWNHACETMRLVCKRKAMLLSFATGFYTIALLLLLLPLMAACVCLR